jgi:hypothetical protein
MTSFSAGDKIEIIGRTLRSPENGLVGEVLEASQYSECLIEFRLTCNQYRSTGWSYDDRQGDVYVVKRWYDNQHLRIHRPKKVLTSQEKTERDALKAKANRSPVEDFILFGLEE